MRRERYSVINKTRGTCLASEAEAARSVFRRAKGLIGRSVQAFASGKGLWIFPCSGIHTFGMSFPIDVAYLDSTERILRIYKQLAPFRIAALMVHSRSILELPAGTLERTFTEVGDVLEFRPCSNVFGVCKSSSELSEAALHAGNGSREPSSFASSANHSAYGSGNSVSRGPNGKRLSREHHESD